MMPFIRVKNADPAAPQHEFDATVRSVEAHPERFIVIDAEPVADARPPKTVPERKVAATKRTSTPKGPASSTRKKAPAVKRTAAAAKKAAAAVKPVEVVDTTEAATAGLLQVGDRALSVAEAASQVGDAPKG